MRTILLCTENSFRRMLREKRGEGGGERGGLTAEHSAGWQWGCKSQKLVLHGLHNYFLVTASITALITQIRQAAHKLFLDTVQFKLCDINLFQGYWAMLLLKKVYFHPHWNCCMKSTDALGYMVTVVLDTLTGVGWPSRTDCDLNSVFTALLSSIYQQRKHVSLWTFPEPIHRL